MRHHFEQHFHVAHRLDRYRAGRRLEFEATSPEVLATTIADEMSCETDYQPVETDGAARAAARIAEPLN